MKEIIIDNIVTNSTLASSTVHELVDLLEDKGLAKDLDNDYVFSQDYTAIENVVKSYNSNIVSDFVDAVKIENRITILNHGENYFN